MLQVIGLQRGEQNLATEQQQQQYISPGILQKRTLELAAISPPVDWVLSELFMMAHLSWVALHGMAHSFLELHK